MPHMGLADPIEAVVLYQLDNPAETGFHVGRQDIELFPDPAVQQLYKEFLGVPLGEKSHHLLHTKYTARARV